MNSSELSDLKRMFESIDASRRGYLTIDEFTSAIRALN